MCRYGQGDLGSEGVANFLSNHVCREICSHLMTETVDNTGSPQWISIKELHAMRATSSYDSDRNFKSPTTLTSCKIYSPNWLFSSLFGPVELDDQTKIAIILSVFIGCCIFVFDTNLFVKSI